MQVILSSGRKKTRRGVWGWTVVCRCKWRPKQLTPTERPNTFKNIFTSNNRKHPWWWFRSHVQGYCFFSSFPALLSLFSFFSDFSLSCLDSCSTQTHIFKQHPQTRLHYYRAAFSRWKVSENKIKKEREREQRPFCLRWMFAQLSQTRPFLYWKIWIFCFSLSQLTVVSRWEDSCCFWKKLAKGLQVSTVLGCTVLPNSQQRTYWFRSRLFYVWIQGLPRGHWQNGPKRKITGHKEC